LTADFLPAVFDLIHLETAWTTRAPEARLEAAFDCKDR
jgi:hypothetical protein